MFCCFAPAVGLGSLCVVLSQYGAGSFTVAFAFDLHVHFVLSPMFILAVDVVKVSRFAGMLMSLVKLAATIGTFCLSCYKKRLVGATEHMPAAGVIRNTA